MIAAAFVHFEQEVPLYRQVRELVSMSLSEGIPVLFDVARAFRMSRRTLQRRLAERGLSYQTLVGEARRQLTMRLLQQTNFGLIEVAFMTGLSGQSAFKRWAGRTPRSFRIAAQPA